MKRSLRVLVTAVLALSAFACGTQSPEDTSEADLEAINQLREKERAAFSAGDVETLLEVFADEARVMPPNEPGFQGAEEQRRWAENLFAESSIQSTYTDSNVTLAGDWAFDSITFNLTITPVAGGDVVQVVGKGLHIYERQPDGSWKIVLDVWNTDSPLATVQ